jgi:hypothetical protein
VNRTEFVLNNSRDVLDFLRTRFPVYDRSNLFLRDVQYGIQAMFIQRGVRVNYSDAEAIAGAFVEKLEKEKILVPIDHMSWVVHYPDYRTPVRKKAEAPASVPAKTAPARGESGPPAG